MSTLNLGLQCIGLMRQEMDPTFKAEAKKYNSLAKLRDAARRVVDFKTTALDSVAHVKSLLCMLLNRFDESHQKKLKELKLFLSQQAFNMLRMWT